MNQAASYHRALGGDGLTLIGCEFEEDYAASTEKRESLFARSCRCCTAANLRFL